ncbi:hypothetical protein UFOVP325_28 [uncultured Caudovirales phage]|uniref:Uncharacterized protein n=1 Tax=uncultured Caudovirales phage TaxID=2100421 RepID=A0A6J5MQI5_9CAUD|nr:hypothetical protein UFOVP325_28 [uncultured Caudovirales phage]CAB4147350.1 hypothetical protein UFOVP430_23 [uncultured Caudovirales phage]
MGRQLAEDLAGMDNITLEQAITWHLQGNFYPPVPTSMVQPCIKAIELANEAIADGEEYLGNLTDEVALPEGITWRGNTFASVLGMIEGHRLDPWINHSMYCECYGCLPDEDEDN